MPLTAKGQEIMQNMIKEYGEEKGKEVFYAMKNKGELTGVDSETVRFYVTEQLSENMARTPEGYLLCQNVPLTRVGEFLYKANEMLGKDGKPIVAASSDGIVKIQRDEADVFSEVTIKSFEGKPFTLNHPEGFVGPENWQELTHGTVQNVRRGENGQGDLMLADILVTTEEAIRKIENGQREISCGYDADYEDLGGGIGRQKDIIGNHIALVAKGRAGGRCAIQDSVPCTGCGHCTCGKNNQAEVKEVCMVLKKSELKKTFDGILAYFKDEETPEEKEKRLAEEAEAKKQEEEAKEAKDKKVKDDDMYADLDARLKRIEDMLMELLSEEDEEESETKDEDSEEEEEKKKEEKEIKDAEEAEKKEEEEKKQVEDAWPDFISTAEILVPGMGLVKPTKDHLKTFDSLKQEVILRSMDEYGEQIEKICSKNKVKALTRDALDIALTGAAQIVSATRNAKIQSASVNLSGMAVAQSVRDINKANKEAWKRS